MVYKQSLQEWIDSFLATDIHTTDRHITDLSKQEISKKEWIKKSFLIAESSIEYIRTTGHRIFVYIGFALKNRRKPFIPDTLSLEVMDKWTPPFIILSKTRMEKEESYLNHYYIYAGISSKFQIGLENDGIIIQSNIYQRNLVCIYSQKKEIKEDILENIVLSLELLHGHSIRKISEECIGKKVCFFIEGKFSKKNYNEDNISESILNNFLYSSNFIYRVLDFFNKKDEIEKKKWKRAIKLIISFKESSNVDLLIRLFQFFDIFKENDTNYKNALMEEFNLKESEAKFMTKIRNDLVHEGLFLDESLLKNINILEEDSNLKNLLSRTENLFKKVVLLAFYVEEIVVKYFILKLPFSNKGMEVFKGFSKTFGFEISNSSRDEFKNYEELYKQILKS